MKDYVKLHRWDFLLTVLIAIGMINCGRNYSMLYCQHCQHSLQRTCTTKQVAGH